MKILLLGEYSNVHHTLAQGLRALGHEVTVASDGDGWKDYPRDVDLKRTSLGIGSTSSFLWRMLRNFPKFRGYDVVQLIGPVFLELRAERLGPLYRFLRRHNRKIVMGAYGMDYYYIKGCLSPGVFRYSDFRIGEEERDTADTALFKREWWYGAKKGLNQEIALDADAIVAGLYEYWASYQATAPELRDKLSYIPFPIKLPAENPAKNRKAGAPARFFIGIQSHRNAYKGTDIMLRALRRVKAECPEDCKVTEVYSVPFSQYVELMKGNELILDQLYSYTPAMNALEAMAHGLIAVGGGEHEMYELMNEHELRPVLNVLPDEDDVYKVLLRVVKERDKLIPALQSQTRDFLMRHHEYVKVAREYEALYRRLLSL